jgi:hypothetical protein
MKGTQSAYFRPVHDEETFIATHLVVYVDGKEIDRREVDRDTEATADFKFNLYIKYEDHYSDLFITEEEE